MDNSAADNAVREKPQRTVQSVEVGGRLLLALANASAPLPLKELAARADLPPARAHPYLVSFSNLGLIQQVPESGHYALGPAALQLGLTYLNQLDPVRVATPCVEALAQETGLAVAIAVWGNFGPTVIRMIEARHPMHMAMRTGTVMSLYGTATGRVYAALLPTEQLQTITARAVGDPPEMAHQLSDPRRSKTIEEARAEVQQHGVVRTIGLPIPGINAYSAAALDHAGQVALVVTLMGHEDELGAAYDAPAVDALRRAVQTTSAALGAPRS